MRHDELPRHAELWSGHDVWRRLHHCRGERSEVGGQRSEFRVGRVRGLVHYMRGPVLLALFGCTPTPEPTDLGDPPIELEIPDVAPAEVAAGVEEALFTVLAIDLRPVWPAHTDTLELSRPGCPDFYAGTPDLDNRDIPETLGWSWSDLCTAPGGRRFAGWSWWDNTVDVTGDATTEVGATLEASRTLMGNALVSLDSDVQLEFDGEATDSVLRVDAANYASWSYSSLFDATLSGSLVDAVAPGGLRADLFTRTTGGDASTLEVRGNVHFFEHRIEGRYDSITLDLQWAAPQSTSPDDCALEPRGWIGVRDTNAYWTELIFQPRYDDDVTDDPYDNDPLNVCDGCATVYIRGVKQEFTVCPDFSGVWETLDAPEGGEFGIDMRGILAGQF